MGNLSSLAEMRLGLACGALGVGRNVCRGQSGFKNLHSKTPLGDPSAPAPYFFAFFFCCPFHSRNSSYLPG